MHSFNLSAWAVRNTALTGFFVVILMITGLVSYVQLGRSEDPNFAVKAMNVVAFWPGSSAAEMRDQVAVPIEKQLQTIPYFDRSETYATPGYLAIQIWVKDHTPASQVPESFYQVRKKLQDMAGTLPQGVQGPFPDDEFGDVDSILLSISGEGARYRDLELTAEALKPILLQHQSISKIRLYGRQVRQIHVEYDEAQLASLSVTPEAILAALADETIMQAPGTLDTGTQRLRLSLSRPIEDAEAVRNLPVPVGAGRVLRLGDLTNVSAGYQDPPKVLVRQDGVPTLMMGIVMTPGANLTRLDKNVAKTLDAFPLPAGIEISLVANQPEVVRKAIREFMVAFAEALLIVLSVCFVTLGWRTGVVVAMAVPLVLSITFIMMQIMGIELHRVSLGALIIALGLLVDDAIIAMESMTSSMETGAPRSEAAAAAWRSTAFPMLTGTLVTALGFMPVGFAPSSTGEYMQSMFQVIAIALIASWVVAVLFTPWLGVLLLKDIVHNPTPSRRARIGKAVMTRVRALVEWSVDNAWKVIGGIAMLFALACVGFITVQKQFFPISERYELFVQLRLPEGSSIHASSAAAAKVEELLFGHDDVATVSSYIGQGPPRFWLALNPALPNSAYAELVVLARDTDARERLKIELETALDQGLVPGARSRVERFTFGPPVGFPIQYRLSGPDPQELRRIGGMIRDEMAKDSRLVDPHMNWNERAPALRLEIDPDRTRMLGLGEGLVASRIALATEGRVATQLRSGTETIDVLFRAAGPVRDNPDALQDIVIASQDGRPITLSQIARISVTEEEPIIWQRTREMTLTIRSDVLDGIQAPDVSQEIWKTLDTIQRTLPPGYRLEHGGAWEEAAKANLSIAVVFPIGFVLLLTVMMIQVQSWSRLGLVLISAPLGIIGASFALNILGAPFGFVALLGILALSGMDLRNSLILVDQVDKLLDAGLPPRTAIVEATLSRTRPVALTSGAAVLALIPISSSIFWGPMAFAIMGGLSLATFMTIMFLPALYAVWFRRDLRNTEPKPPKTAALSTEVT